MPRTWRSQIADEVRSASMMKPKERASCTDALELDHLSGGGKYLLDGRKRKRLERLGWVRIASAHGGFEVTLEGRVALSEFHSKEG